MKFYHNKIQEEHQIISIKIILKIISIKNKKKLSIKPLRFNNIKQYILKETYNKHNKIKIFQI